MTDAIFSDPRLVAVYDALDPDRGDLAVYAALAAELGAGPVLDVGCGTGVFARLLARAGHEVTGLDPAAASVAYARSQAGAQRVRWLDGDARVLADTDPPVAVELATMTGNAAQAVTDPADWADTLAAVRGALVPGGHLVFETRDPAARAWQDWARDPDHRTAQVPGIGRVESWTELVEVALPLVTIRGRWRFAADGPDAPELASTSTLRFRGREEVAADLAAAGLQLREVRGAPDRPGRELVFLARRAARAARLRYGGPRPGSTSARVRPRCSRRR